MEGGFAESGCVTGVADIQKDSRAALTLCGSMDFSHKKAASERRLLADLAIIQVSA